MNKVVYWIAFLIAFAAFRVIFMKVHLEVILGVLIAGGICSLLPYFLYRKKSPNLAVIFVLVCLAAGVVGGAIVALPAALICTAIGYYKTRNMVTGSGNAQQGVQADVHEKP